MPSTSTYIALNIPTLRTQDMFDAKTIENPAREGEDILMVMYLRGVLLCLRLLVCVHFSFVFSHMLSTLCLSSLQEGSL